MSPAGQSYTDRPLFYSRQSRDPPVSTWDEHRAGRFIRTGMPRGRWKRTRERFEGTDTLGNAVIRTDRRPLDAVVLPARGTSPIEGPKGKGSGTIHCRKSETRLSSSDEQSRASRWPRPQAPIQGFSTGKSETKIFSTKIRRNSLKSLDSDERMAIITLTKPPTGVYGFHIGAHNVSRHPSKSDLY
jgi:hypothetical protein